MDYAWISLETFAERQGIPLSEAAALAEREHWPKVFKLHETLVLAPSCCAGARAIP